VAIDDFRLAAGKVTFLFGESGIGKSLLARAVYGLLDPSELDIRFDDGPYAEYLRSPDTAAFLARGFFVFQEPSTHLNPVMTLGAQLQEGRLARAPRAADVLAPLWSPARRGELPGLLDLYPRPHRPSGGEKQRVLLGMAFAAMGLLSEGDNHDALFVFDEPTGNLDNEYRDIVLDRLLACHAEKRFTALFVTHDYSLLSRLTGAHSGALDRVVLRELVLAGQRVDMRDFHPRRYSEWLRRQVPAGVGGRGEVLLRMESGLRAHGRRLRTVRAPASSEDVPLVVEAGHMVYLKGPSGEGKTTLVKALLGLTACRDLRARAGAHDIRETLSASYWREHLWGGVMTMVFQHADEALNPASTVGGVFEGLPGLSRRADVSGMLRDLFDLPDVAPFLRRRVATLSGGQKQRLNLLRGLALRTDLLILDEPLNGLDFESTEKVIALLRRRLAEGTGILVISHNEEIFDALVHPDDIYFLRGEILRGDAIPLNH
jgi:peptide/nickel transport system ATP-binding protein